MPLTVVARLCLDKSSEQQQRTQQLQQSAAIMKKQPTWKHRRTHAWSAAQEHKLARILAMLQLHKCRHQSHQQQYTCNNLNTSASGGQFARTGSSCLSSGCMAVATLPEPFWSPQNYTPTVTAGSPSAALAKRLLGKHPLQYRELWLLAGTATGEAAVPPPPSGACRRPLVALATTASTEAASTTTGTK